MVDGYLQISRNGQILEFVFDKPKVKTVARQSEKMSLSVCYRSMRAADWPMLQQCLQGVDFAEVIAAFEEKRKSNQRGC